MRLLSSIFVLGGTPSGYLAHRCIRKHGRVNAAPGRYAVPWVGYRAQILAVFVSFAFRFILGGFLLNIEFFGYLNNCYLFILICQTELYFVAWALHLFSLEKVGHYEYRIKFTGRYYVILEREPHNSSETVTSSYDSNKKKHLNSFTCRVEHYIFSTWYDFSHFYICIWIFQA